MADDWRTRLRAEMKKKDVSMRKLALDAGFGPSFVKEMLDYGKEPSVANLRKICETLGASFAYVATGITVSPEAEEVMAIYTMLPEEDRQALLRLTRAMRRDGDNPDDDPAPGEAVRVSRAPARR